MSSERKMKTEELKEKTIPPPKSVLHGNPNKQTFAVNNAKED